MSYFEFPHTRTYDSDLGWLIKTMKEITEMVSGFDEWKTTHEEEYEQLKALYDAIMSGHFPPEVKDAFERWARQNMPDLVKEMIKNVWFAINDQGYFVAYIPDSWSDIIFNTTGLDITLAIMPEYGHLVLSY